MAAAARPQAPPPKPADDIEGVPVPTMSPSLSAFAPAFVRVQLALRPVVKNATNLHFQNNFADLASILEEALPLLNNNGFALLQFPSNQGGQLALMSMLVHESGQFISSTMPLLLQKQDPQGEGSAITYGRRYAACAILGIRTADDDGNASVDREPDRTPATRPERVQEAQRRLAKPPAEGQTVEQQLGWADDVACKAAHDAVIAQIRALAPEVDRTELNAFRKAKGIPMSPDDLSALSMLVAKATTPSPSAGQEDGPDPDPPGPQPDAPAPAPEAPSASGAQPNGWDGLTCPWCEKPVAVQGSVMMGGKGPDDPVVRYHKEPCYREWQDENRPMPEEEG